MLTNVARVKALLAIPAEESAWNGELSALIEGIDAELLELTGYDLASTTRTEYFHTQQLGRAFHLGRRPIQSITSVQGRSKGDQNFITLSHDLLDPNEGRLVAVGDFSGAGWPPQEATAEWYRWREQTYDVMKVVYVTAAASIPKDLESVATELAVYRFRRVKAGASQGSSLAGVSENYMTDAIPDWVYGKLARHIRARLVHQ